MNRTVLNVVDEEAQAASAGALLRHLVIALTAFLTVVDLFATQAILPSLTQHYGVTPAAMGFAVNASTMGMAVSGLTVGYFSGAIDRRAGILASLVALPCRRRCSRTRPISRPSRFFAWRKAYAWRQPSLSRSPI